ncbi:hypothetical protein GCM10011581_27020 [Saccharopolyspora subtropica]|uniref:Uncharacterized protein n=1 Tax=Saccharopolyspora thermophila TaxID=89367 RepID=A0A917NCJ2_9PSEU|nr:hypothetical protein [Saccharopolyspora subtropica]GGI88512.1 hypothetical protein GCM10011581_27020 [Saccharopolyspora subtropica]
MTNPAERRQQEADVNSVPGSPRPLIARVAGSFGAAVLALGGLATWVATIDANLRYGSAGVALPYSLFWSMVWFVLCWGAVGVLAAGFGRRSRVATIALWAAVLVTLVGIVVAIIALPRSQM